MAWVIPAPAVTGNPIPTSFGNDVIGDLTILETTVGLFTVGPAIAGSPPSVGTPNFLIAAGATTQTTNSAGQLSYTWPTPFPNGLLTISLTVGNQLTGPNAQVSVIGIASGCTSTGFTAVASEWSGSAWVGVNSAPVVVNFLAVGF